jgi:hypothetical protein
MSGRPYATEEAEAPGPRYAHAMAAAEAEGAVYLFGGELAGTGAGGGLWRLDAAAAEANAVSGRGLHSSTIQLNLSRF